MPDDGLIDGDSAVDLCILDEEEGTRHSGRPPLPPGQGRGGCLGVLLLVVVPPALLAALLLL
ncbi:MAG: hypothetical protein BWK76_06640 [Desulfobulbaceae bacterium A2]|nr:MAG: hypothetical protein BWK76_06640 [Desulfobulbaceae bacterium A2]